MRLGKKKEKEKDVEARSQYIENVSRMICSVRSSHNTPLKGNSVSTLYTGCPVIIRTCFYFNDCLYCFYNTFRPVSNFTTFNVPF